jgi:hypothetical protein
MTITCDGGDLLMGPFFQGGRYDTYLHTKTGETIPNFKPFEDRKKTIKDALEGLIALEYEKSVVTNK